jgi:hypothetical protein
LGAWTFIITGGSGDATTSVRHSPVSHFNPNRFNELHAIRVRHSTRTSGRNCDVLIFGLIVEGCLYQILNQNTKHGHPQTH